MKAAIFSCNGLGDGLISSLLASNLALNEYRVDLFHNSLTEMQIFFNSFTIKKYPNKNDLEHILSYYDQIFISFDASNDFSMNLIDLGKKKCEDKIFVLNPCPSKKIGSQPYYSDAFFNPKNSMVENIEFFCKKVLRLEKTSKKINYVISHEIEHKKYKNRIIIHPSSAKNSKNWSLEKYIELSKVLKSLEYEIVFVISEKEKKDFKEVEKANFTLKAFNNLKDLTYFVYESSFMIGNDSGIGHLSSMLGLPTISIFRNYRSALLWRPGWNRNIIIYPNRFIPNISLYRLRDRHWKKFISVKKIIKQFLKIKNFKTIDLLV